jgi:hypothetical protein
MARTGYAPVLRMYQFLSNTHLLGLDEGKDAGRVDFRR